MTTEESRNDYVLFANAVAQAVSDYARAEGLPWPHFTLRYRTAAHAWRTLHPDSEFGGEFGPWPDPPPHVDVSTVPPGTIERMAASDARPSPALREAIERARQRRGGGSKP